MEQVEAIDVGALYRPVEIYSEPGRRGRLPISKTTLYEWISSGRLPALKLSGGRTTLIRGADLLALFGSQQ